MGGGWRLILLTKTTMSPFLPPEILDLVVDHLHHERTTLRTCCLVSKSWVSRAQSHIFADISFWSRESIKFWMKAFPDPSNSPAHHTRSLRISALAVASVASQDARPWLRSFQLVVTLSVDGHRMDGGFSEVIDLICSFPLLEDLFLWFSASDNSVDHDWDTPSPSPKLNGTLLLKRGGSCLIIPRLLRLPGGLHFTQIQVSCPVDDSGSIPDLVLRCSDTLESLHIRYYPIRAFSPTLAADTYLIATTVSGTSRKPSPLDLSKATRLKNVDFQSNVADIQWITKSLGSAGFESLRKAKITASLPINFADQIEGVLHRELVDLDRLLVELWTLRSVALWVRCENAGGRNLLPEITSREGVRLLEDYTAVHLRYPSDIDM